MAFLYCCNSCGKLPGYEESHPYFMSSCGHIQCGNCCQIGGASCPTCHISCRFAEIGNGTNLKPEIKMYFGDPLDILKDAVHRVLKVRQFQKAQAKLYQTQLDKVFERNKSLEVQLDTLATENSVLKAQLNSIQQEKNWMGTGIDPRSVEDRNRFFDTLPNPEPSPFFGPLTNKSRTQNCPSVRSPSDNVSFSNEHVTRRHTPSPKLRPHGQNPAHHICIDRRFPAPSLYGNIITENVEFRNASASNANLRWRPNFNHPVVVADRGNNAFTSSSDILSRLSNFRRRRSNR